MMAENKKDSEVAEDIIEEEQSMEGTTGAGQGHGQEGADDHDTGSEHKQGNELRVLKKEKRSSKSTLTRARNGLLNLLNTALPINRDAVLHACEKLENAQEAVYQACEQLLDYYESIDDLTSASQVGEEIDSIEADVNDAMDIVSRYLKSAIQPHIVGGSSRTSLLSDSVDKSPSVTSDQSVDVNAASTSARQPADAGSVSIAAPPADAQQSSLLAAADSAVAVCRSEVDANSRAVTRESSLSEVREQSAVAGHSASQSADASLRASQSANASLRASHSADLRGPLTDTDQETFAQPYVVHPSPGAFEQSAVSLQQNELRHNEAAAWGSPGQQMSSTRTETTHRAPHPTANLTQSASVGQDLWRQLKRVSIPTFSGDKKQYEHWKATFNACVDKAPASPEYKLLQLRDCLSGEALKVIESLGHSGTAYTAALDRLERKYGGKRRQIQLQFDELKRFSPMRPGHAKDLERFADLLDIVYINLKESGLESDLDSQLLYSLLLEKMTQCMVANYKRWVMEHHQRESIELLRQWIIAESDFQTAAYESVRGSTSTTQPSRAASESQRQRGRSTYTVVDHTRASTSSACQLCNRPGHEVWRCEQMRRKSPDDRWEVAKQLYLCFRCLGRSHRGTNCPRTKVCGVNGCRSSHHSLLHRERAHVEQQGSRPVSHRPHTADRAAAASTTQHSAQATAQHTAPADNPTSSSESKCPSAPPAQPATKGEQQANDRTHAAAQITAKAYTAASQVALRTVPVVLQNGVKSVTVNALLDDGSTTTFINTDLVEELGLQGTAETAKVSVLNGQIETFESKIVTFTLASVDNKYMGKIEAKTINNVTGDLETLNWNQYKKKWPHLAEIKFPDIGKHRTVGLLIGLDNSELHYSLKDVRGSPGEPIARLTPLGWTCIGRPTKIVTKRTMFARSYLSHDDHISREISATLRQFWEVETSGIRDVENMLHTDDKLAMNQVAQSLTHTDGVYQVGIPWKNATRPNLPDTKQTATKRLISTERRLMQQPAVGTAYSKIIQQYVEKGYVRQVSQDEAEATRCYLPHFAVTRQDRSTTKTRIVFDASAATAGTALNDEILQGPKLQRDLFDVLLRFRRHPVAVVCDIAEMYLQIELAPEDRPYHRFLWRDLDQNKPPDIYEFNRVVFGVNASPFIAQYVSQEHARKHKTQYPLAAETVLKSTYMDDNLDSAPDVSTGRALRQQLSELWARAGMHARKWLSNSPEILEDVPSADRASEINLEEGELPKVKTLGVLWAAADDAFSFRFSEITEDFHATKRTVLRKVATIFDPLGFVSPYVIRGKMLLQEMWAAGVDWDDPIPLDIDAAAKTWLKELRQLENVRVPRCIRLDAANKQKNVTVHVFVDASEKAYGAVAYAATEYECGARCVRLVASKSHVAPLVSLSIPRLETMAAVLGLRLSLSVTKALEYTMDNVVFWSDSMNVLWWVRGRSRHYKPFIAHRIGEIQQHSSPHQWRYVPTQVNPADLISRGAKADELAANDLWWKGPLFLTQDVSKWPIPACAVLPKAVPVEALPEMKTQPPAAAAVAAASTFATTISQGDPEMTVDYRGNPTRHSDWCRLYRLTALVLRFVNNCRTPTSERQRGELTTEEIMEAQKHIIRREQQSQFAVECAALNQQKPLPTASKLLGLNPQLDADGILRIDGRLRNAEFIPYEARCPIILPRHSHVTSLIIRHEHAAGNHGIGTNQTLSELRKRYWIIAGREAVRQWEKECAVCRRRKATPAQQIMAPLPSSRVQQTPSRAFARTSVDFAGPYTTKQGRGKARQKRYLCLFTCMATRAVHLELAHGLDTDSFLNALHRMVNRRGVPQEMTSDNGTNFVGAHNELKELMRASTSSKAQRASTELGITWKFNPPLAPHFGGVHESLVKSAKKALQAVLGDADVTDEELATVITGVEALMNSRPLTHISTNPLDEPPLSPKQFLHGHVEGQLVPDIVDGTDYNLRRRWRRVQDLIKHAWRRWMAEWIPELNRRSKWRAEKPDIKEGDTVIVVNPNTSRGEWPLAVVTAVHPGIDGHVRVATVKTGQSTITRPITKLCPLDWD